MCAYTHTHTCINGHTKRHIDVCTYVVSIQAHISWLCPLKGPRSSNTSRAMCVSSTQILVPKNHPPIEGTRVPWGK